MRISKPFPELTQYANSVDTKQENIQTVPFVGILMKAREKWLETNPIPSTRAERDSFKDFIKKLYSATNDIPANISEAISHSHLAWKDDYVNINFIYRSVAI